MVDQIPPFLAEDHLALHSSSTVITIEFSVGQTLTLHRLMVKYEDRRFAGGSLGLFRNSPRIAE